MKLKKMAVFALTAMLCFQQNLPTYAQTQTSRVWQENVLPSVISPLWTNLHSIYLGLSYDNGLASCTITMLGYTGTTNIYATLSLQRQTSSGWVTDKAWGFDIYGDYLGYNKTYPEEEGSFCRLLLTATVTRNGKPETVTVSTDGCVLE